MRKMFSDIPSIFLGGNLRVATFSGIDFSKLDNIYSSEVEHVTDLNTNEPNQVLLVC